MNVCGNINLSIRLRVTGFVWRFW